MTFVSYFFIPVESVRQSQKKKSEIIKLHVRIIIKFTLDALFRSSATAINSPQKLDARESLYTRKYENLWN